MTICSFDPAGPILPVLAALAALAGLVLLLLTGCGPSHPGHIPVLPVPATHVDVERPPAPVVTYLMVQRGVIMADFVKDAKTREATEKAVHGLLNMALGVGG